MTDEKNNEEEMIPKSALDNMISKDQMQEYIAEQVNIQFANKVEQERKATKARRDGELEVRNQYTGVMKDSPEPWVDLQGYTETPQGLKISLEWNDAFIDHLKTQGLTGSDEDEVVHRWLAMLMQDVAEDTDPRNELQETL